MIAVKFGQERQSGHRETATRNPIIDKDHHLEQRAKVLVTEGQGRTQLNPCKGHRHSDNIAHLQKVRIELAANNKDDTKYCIPIDSEENGRKMAAKSNQSGWCPY